MRCMALCEKFLKFELKLNCLFATLLTDIFRNGCFIGTGLKNKVGTGMNFYLVSFEATNASVGLEGVGGPTKNKL